MSSDEIMLTIGEDGIARSYDDTYDIVIHCESEEEQEKAKKLLMERNGAPAVVGCIRGRNKAPVDTGHGRRRMEASGR